MFSVQIAFCHSAPISPADADRFHKKSIAVSFQMTEYFFRAILKEKPRRHHK
jgi:hypothetical protein